MFDICFITFRVAILGMLDEEIESRYCRCIYRSGERINDVSGKPVVTVKCTYALVIVLLTLLLISQQISDLVRLQSTCIAREINIVGMAETDKDSQKLLILRVCAI